MTLSEFFFVKLWIDSDLVCIGELQLLWMDKNSDQVLSSLRLYFLPENTPEGRMDHGEVGIFSFFPNYIFILNYKSASFNVNETLRDRNKRRCHRNNDAR